MSMSAVFYAQGVVTKEVEEFFLQIFTDGSGTFDDTPMGEEGIFFINTIDVTSQVSRFCTTLKLQLRNYVDLYKFFSPQQIFSAYYGCLEERSGKTDDDFREMELIVHKLQELGFKLTFLLE
jgi:hypothetical protein